MYLSLPREIADSQPMLPAWVMGFPDGNEKGPFLALDLGGTNLRVCEVVLLKEGRKFDMIQSKYRLVWNQMGSLLMIAFTYQNCDWRATI